MRYLDTKQDKRQTESQLKRRGLMKSEIDLEKIGIVPLSEAKPEGYDKEVHTLTDKGNKQDEDGNYQIDYSLGFKTRAVLEAVLFARIAEKRWQKEEGGCFWNENPVDTDRIAQPKITTEFVAATSGLRADGEYWKMRDETFVSMTNEEFKEMATAVRTHISGCYSREAMLKGLIQAATDEAEAYQTFLDEFDTGWPETVKDSE